VEQGVPATDEFSAPVAAALAGITYRQLDYWARRGWMVPSHITKDPDRRRSYALSEVILLGALGHVGRSGLDVAHYATVTGQLDVPERAGFLIVWETDSKRASVTRAKDLCQLGQVPGQYVVFDPTPVLVKVRRHRSETGRQSSGRRRFPSAYKLAVLSEYEAATSSGAKSEILRREGLHTSYLVQWGRARAAGVLRPG